MRRLFSRLSYWLRRGITTGVWSALLKEPPTAGFAPVGRLPQPTQLPAKPLSAARHEEPVRLPKLPTLLDHPTQMATAGWVPQSLAPREIKLQQEVGQSVLPSTPFQERTPQFASVSNSLQVIPPPLERTIIVGVDFGTSSTKVIWQDLGDNHFEVFQWHHSRNGLPSNLLPSTVMIRDGFIYFGLSSDDVRDGDVWLPSIKLCVLCRHDNSICRCNSAAARHGMVRPPDSGDSIAASSFACLFLAYVFQQVESSLAARFPDDELLLIWNLGCPMDHVDESSRKNEWERMAGLAIDLHSDMSDPVQLSLLAGVTRRLPTFAVPTPDDRNYFVQPEGLAAVKAFLESPHAESKSYAIVDVGAGTTEVSFFFYGHVMTEVGRPLRPSYLADTTAAVGGGKIDLELAQAWGCAVEDARRRKEAGSPTAPVVGSIDEICSQYRRTSCEILRRNLLTGPDRRFDLFLIGGGARLFVLTRALSNLSLPVGLVLEHRRRLTPPRSLKNHKEFNENWDLLANACGLASSVYWDYYPTSESNPIPPKPVREKLDRETIYAK